MYINARKKGFTLLEVLVCLGVIGILFLPLLTFFSGSMEINVASKEKQRAINVAQEVMEEMRSYDNISSMNASSTLKRTEANFTTAVTDNELIDSTTNDFKNTKYYYVSNTNTYKSDGKDYSVKVTVDCSKYVADIFSKIPNLTSLGGGNSVMATEADETKNALSIYQKKNQVATNTAGLSFEELAKHLHKKIKVFVTDSAMDGGSEMIPEGMIRVQVYNEYTMDSSVKGCSKTITSDKIFNDIVKYDEFKELYLFYRFDVYAKGEAINDCTPILTEIDLDVRFDKHASWKPDFNFNTVCQKIKRFGEYDSKDDDSKGDDIKQFNKTLLISKKFQGSVLTISDTSIPIKSNIGFSVQNDSGGSDVGTALDSMEAFIDDQKTQRFADVTVQVFGQNPNKVEAELKSTVMLSLEDRSVI